MLLRESEQQERETKGLHTRSESAKGKRERERESALYSYKQKENKRKTMILAVRAQPYKTSQNLGFLRFQPPAEPIIEREMVVAARPSRLSLSLPQRRGGARTSLAIGKSGDALSELSSFPALQHPPSLQHTHTHAQINEHHTLSFARDYFLE